MELPQFERLHELFRFTVQQTTTFFAKQRESTTYSALSNDTESDHEGGTPEEKSSPIDSGSSQVRRSPHKRMVIQISILLCSLIFAGLGFGLGVSHGKSSVVCPRCYVDDEQCTIHLSTASPAIDASAIEYFTELWPAPFHAEHAFSGPPTYERELAWREHERGRVISIPRKKLAALKKTEDIPRLMTPPEAGDGYAATLMVHHQLQCLGALRRWTYKDEYLATMVEIPELFRAPTEEVHKRLDYCVDLLRRSVLCTSDVTPILLPLNSSAHDGFDMDLWTTHKKCRNFQKITEWEEEHIALDIDVSFSNAFPL